MFSEVIDQFSQPSTRLASYWTFGKMHCRLRRYIYRWQHIKHSHQELNK